MPLGPTWVLCNIALFLVQLSASINVTLSRTAFQWFDPARQEAVAPIVFGTTRSVIALLIFSGIRVYWRWKYVTPLKYEFLLKTKSQQDLKFLREQEEAAAELSQREQSYITNESIVTIIEFVSPRENLAEQQCSKSASKKQQEEEEEAIRKKKNNTDGNNLLEVYLTSTDATNEDVLKIMLLGIIGIPINLLCFLNGVALTDGITTGAFASTIPVCCFVIARLLRVEVLSTLKLVAVTCVVFGNCVMIEVWKLIVGDGGASSGGKSASYYFGCLSFLGNVVAWSIYLVLQRPLLKRVHRLEFLFWFYVGGVTALVIFAVLWDGSTLYRQLFTPGLLSGWSWMSMCYAGFVNATMPYWLLAYGIEHGGPVLASAWNATQPVLLLVEALTFLGETLSSSKIWGGLIVLVGVAMTVVAQAQGHAPASKASSSSSSDIKMMRESPRHTEVTQALPM